MGQTPKQKYHEEVAKIRSKHQLPGNALVAPGYGCWASYCEGVIVAKTTPGFSPDAVLLQDISDVQFRPAGPLRNGILKLKANKTIDLTFRASEEPTFAHFKDVLFNEIQRGVQGVLPPAFQQASAKPMFGMADEKFRTKYKIPADAVLARSAGTGYISFDGHFVTIQHIGVSRGVVGKAVKRFPITGITNIQLKPAGWVVPGYLQITAGGSNEVKSRFGYQSWDAMHDENSMDFNSDDQPAFLAVRDAIENAQRALHTPRPAPPAQPSHDDVLAQLERLGRLRDAGVITEEEFAAKKADLLGRL